MNFKLRPLVGFVLAAHRGSFSAAANEISMTQPAFSQMIKGLESTLGLQLFERTTRQIELTESGRQLLAMVERPLDDLETAWNYVRDVTGGKRGQIAFAVLPTIAFGLATKALARFKQNHPGITARLIENQGWNIPKQVLSREVDFGIGTLDSHQPELTFRELVRDEVMAVVRADHPLAKGGQASWKMLAGEPHILLPRQSNVRFLVDNSFAACGIRIEPAYEVANMVTALGMIRAGLGITFLSRLVLSELNMSDLVALQMNQPRRARTIGLITCADRELSVAAAAYVRLLFEEAGAKIHYHEARPPHL